MIFHKIKYAAAAIMKKHPYTWSWAWNNLSRIKFLLPHDKSYFGFRHLAKEAEGLFLDVGANNGISAVGFRRINKNYRILSIEANRNHESTLRKLKSSIAGFDYIIMGAGDKKSSATIFTPIYKGIPIYTHTSTSLNYLKVSLQRDFSEKIVKKITYDKQIVEMSPLDDLDLKPHIIKIDVEGHEHPVLLGLKQTILRHRPFIMVEYTPHFMKNVDSFFHEHLYNALVYDDAQDGFLHFIEERENSSWKSNVLQVNLFFIPKEKLASIPILTI